MSDARRNTEGRRICARVMVTTFTDPMMGLSYEMEPVYRKLETHFGSSLSFRYRMGLLVPDVMRLVDPLDRSLGDAVAIERYDERLAQTYLGEEPIGGIPIVMEGFHLFSDKERSTMPLCLAYEAARLVAPDRADRFLYALRYATIAETRPTTRLDEILSVAGKTGIHPEALKAQMESSAARDALSEDLSLALRLGIHTLPTVVLTCEENGLIVSGLARYDVMVKAIAEVSGGRVVPHSVDATEEALHRLLAEHPLISAPEIVAALDMNGEGAARELAAPLVEDGTASMIPVKRSWFLKSAA